MGVRSIRVTIDMRGALASAIDQLNGTEHPLRGAPDDMSRQSSAALLEQIAAHLDQLVAGRVGLIAFLRFYGLIVGPEAMERQPTSLLDKAETEALAIVATWLEDCEDHLALRRTGGLPAAPFNFAEAWVMVRQASLRAAAPVADAA